MYDIQYFILTVLPHLALQAPSYLQVRKTSVLSVFVCSTFSSSHKPEHTMSPSAPSRSRTLSLTSSNCRQTPTTCCRTSTRWVFPKQKAPSCHLLADDPKERKKNNKHKLRLCLSSCPSGPERRRTHSAPGLGSVAGEPRQEPIQQYPAL